MSREDFNERKEARIERLHTRSEKEAQKSAEYYEASRNTVSGIPFGQPILVGHHSERAHRNTIARSHRQMDKSCEASAKSTEYERRAKAAERNGAIFSDDPTAVRKLKEKLESLERNKQYMKDINTAYRAFKKNPESLESSDLDERAKEIVRTWFPKYSFERSPFAPYSFQNIGATIRTTKKRIEEMELLDEKETTDTQIGDVKIVENAEANRTQAFFPDKPSETIRKSLKSNGFRWSPKNGCWQRHLNSHATALAERIAKEYNEAGQQ